ncbi:MAG: type 1 glutamine amidotransferase [Actinomycetota bacterium]
MTASSTTAGRRALFIMHDPEARPGYVGERMTARGLTLELLPVAPTMTDSNPTIDFGDPGAYDVIVPLGSVWSVYDTDTIGNWITNELRFLAEAHRRRIPILGICFGGQALAAALGGTVSRAPSPEIGWRTIDSDRPEDVADGPWMQWHYDRFTVPAEATEIARNDAGPQAFVAGRSLGLQFHPEVSHEIITGWLAGAPAEELERPEVDLERLRRDAAELAPAARARTERLVDWFLDDVAGLDLPTMADREAPGVG